jgi:hypothetical protein
MIVANSFIYSVFWEKYQIILFSSLTTAITAAIALTTTFPCKMMEFI